MTDKNYIPRALEHYANRDNYIFVVNDNYSGYLYDVEGYPWVVAQQALEETK